ncbi:MAG: hypothetical protein COV79_03860 [Parcubacteria group bacterium CG11_big_fil_rev_8_21_14_0_20_41_14]|nr:MAG: hypothetical protein COV79_03860 [Parcubacteria group bacterium CG11_big_fil_rev_8_21_14_0_20_41_14]PIZ79868.1 MAG: hypothetical protein COY02_03745 [Parcubacteria group bacterium CG_4_10_14_0_2_um_filter_41_6]
MQVKIKRIDKALPLPQYETQGAVAFDFIARVNTVIEPHGIGRIPSNIVLEIPKGYMVLVKDRSSTAKKKGILMTAGVIDQDYCGDNDEILMQFYNPSDVEITVKRGERVAQGIFVAVGIGEWEEVDIMNKKDRGGFGTTDQKQSSEVQEQKIRIDSITPKKAQKGKLIVLDGTDGSGKATQTDILLDRIKKEGYKSSKIDFPKYSEKSAGLIENYLNGRYGNPDELNPYIASLFYALDRYDASFDFKKLLNNGEVVVSNRYTSSNMGHQGSKFTTPELRKEYFEWLDTYEHEIFKIPRPDLTVILHVPTEYAQELLEKKGTRNYIDGKNKDLLESDLGHQKRAEQTYLEMAQEFENFELIECVQNGRLLSIEEISELVWEKALKII